MTIRQQIAENKHYPIEIIKCKNCHYHEHNLTTDRLICRCNRKEVNRSWACKYFRVMKYS